MTHECLKHTTRVPPAVYGQAVTHTVPSRAGMVQPLLWQPLEPQYRPTAVETMSSHGGDMHNCDVRRDAGTLPGRCEHGTHATYQTRHSHWHVWSAEFVLWHVPDAHSQLEVCLRLSTLSLLLDNCCQGQISAIRPARQSAEPSRHPNSPDYRRRLWRKLIGGAALGGGGVGARVREHRKTR